MDQVSVGQIGHARRHVAADADLSLHIWAIRVRTAVVTGTNAARSSSLAAQENRTDSGPIFSRANDNISSVHVIACTAIDEALPCSPVQLPCAEGSCGGRRSCKMA